MENLLPKVVMTDVDGVWTDGGMYYDQHGNELKKFNTSDSHGVLYCRMLDIPVAIITGEQTTIVESRAKKLGIDMVYQGVQNKLQVARQIAEDHGCTLDEMAYIGDDLIDISVLEAVGISGCPANARGMIKDKVDIVTTVPGGEGSFREFVETILEKNGKLIEVRQRYMEERS